VNHFANAAAVFSAGMVAGVLALFSVGQDAASPRPNAATSRYEAVKALWEDAVLHAQLGQRRMGDAEDEDHFRWSLRLAESAAAAGAMSPADAFGAHLTRMQKLLEVTEGLVKAGRKSTPDLNAVRFFVADAQCRVLEHAK
jgi:hypothetical protein